MSLFQYRTFWYVLFSLILFVVDRMLPYISFVPYFIGCILYILGVFQLSRDVKRKSKKIKLYASIFVFLWTGICYIIFNYTLTPLGPAGMVLFYFLGAQVIAILLTINRLYLTFSILLSTYLSFVYLH